MSDVEIKHPDAPATEKQLDYLKSLAENHDIGMDMEVWEILFKTWVGNGMTTKAFVSDLIDQYLQCPKRPGHEKTTQESEYVRPAYYKRPAKKAPLVELDLGYYEANNPDGSKTYFHVVKTRDGQRTYAKVLMQDNSSKAWSWEYEPGAIRTAATGSKISLGEANRWITAHKICFVCCKEAHKTWPGRCAAALGSGTAGPRA